MVKGAGGGGLYSKCSLDHDHALTGEGGGASMINESCSKPVSWEQVVAVG